VGATNKTRFPSVKRGEPRNLPELTKHVAIIGDSNLDRITNMSNDHLDIISFLGMSLYQANKLIDGYEYGPNSSKPAAQPKDIIISVGINDRENAGQTLRTCLNKLYFSCRRKFPNSNIWVPEVNADLRLPGGAIQTIRVLNSHIKLRFGLDFTIPILPSNKFNTCDKERHPFIHWTEPCANAMLQHWLDHLNRKVATPVIARPPNQTVSSI
jgi:hypothetical protein